MPRPSSISTSWWRSRKLPNVAVKATGAPHYSTQALSVPEYPGRAAAHLRAFGPKRFFWGTDITRMPCSYRQCVTFFTEELPWLKGKDLEDGDGPQPVRVDRLGLQVARLQSPAGPEMTITTGASQKILKPGAASR